MKQNQNIKRIEMLLDNKLYDLARLVAQEFDSGSFAQENLKTIFKYCVDKCVETNNSEYCLEVFKTSGYIYDQDWKKVLFVKLLDHCLQKDTVDHKMLAGLAEEVQDTPESVWEKILTQTVKAQNLNLSLKILKRYLKRDFQKNEIEDIFKQYNDEKIFKDMVDDFTKGHCGNGAFSEWSCQGCYCNVIVFSEAELPFILEKCINEGWVTTASIVSLKMRSQEYRNKEILEIEKENIPSDNCLLEKQEIQDLFKVLVVGKKETFFDFCRLFYPDPDEETMKWIIRQSLKLGVVSVAKNFASKRDKKFTDYLDDDTLADIYQIYLKEALLDAALEYFEETRDRSADYLSAHGLPIPEIAKKDLQDIYTNALKKGDWKTAKRVIMETSFAFVPRRKDLSKREYQEILITLIDAKFFKEAQEVQSILSRYPFSR